MYLDYWMIATLIFSFGICHWISRRQGMNYGAMSTLKLLETEKIIKITDDGIVTRYNTWPTETTKKKKDAKF